MFRTLHGFGDLEVVDVSFQKKRFDHIIASRELDPTECYYDPTGLECSDHAPIIAGFDF